MKKTNFERYRDIAPKNRENRRRINKNIASLDQKKREDVFLLPKNRKRKELKQNQLFKKLFRYSPFYFIITFQ